MALSESWSQLLSAYPAIKTLHLWCVSLSIGLFSVRLIATWAGASWPMHSRVRHLSVTIDVLLLCAGLTLWTLLQLNPLRDTWLGVKLLLLVAYVVLGSWALKRAPTLRAKMGCGLTAWLCVAAMAVIAQAHQVPFF